MGKQNKIRDSEKIRRTRERYIIVIISIIISALVYVTMRTLHFGSDLPFQTNILVFALINTNVILLLLLFFLIVRNLVKLFFERRKNVLGSKLRSKLVIAFMSLSLLPTVILFFVSVQFISVAVDYWFNLRSEETMDNSVLIAREYYDRIHSEVLSFGNNLARIITHEGYMIASRQDALKRFLDDKRKEYYFTIAAAYSGSKFDQKHFSNDPAIDIESFLKQLPLPALSTAFEEGKDSRFLWSLPTGELVGGVIPIFSRTESKAVVGVLVLARFIPANVVSILRSISRGVEEYRQLKMFKNPVKFTHMITFSIVTLLIMFSSLWFGFYLSKEIAVPIMELATGTKRIASGDYDFTIDLVSKDEIGLLVNSFNQMTHDLKTGKEKLEYINLELIKSNEELEQRRRYMEFVLANIAAGVVTIDSEGEVLTVNKSAEIMLKVKADSLIGCSFEDIIPDEYLQIIDDFFTDKVLFKKGFLKKQITISIDGTMRIFLVLLNVLTDERDNYIGLVAVFEDLTDIEKAQRMAAWREVATRIAHEVKNPLTPIKLNAQRLRKKYGEQFKGNDKSVFYECTEMIERQADELKRLVDEFSNFARMPILTPSLTSINNIIDEALSLYKEAHPDITFLFEGDANIPDCYVDREQIKRVMINLIDNAIEATGSFGKINLLTSYDSFSNTANIEISDSGVGIEPQDKSRLFEPYFSTKKHGTGLGLTIVAAILADHNGSIKFQDNSPSGVIVKIKLPVANV